MALKLLMPMLMARAVAGQGESPAATVQQPENILDPLVGKALAYVMPWARNDEFVGAKHIHVTDAALSLSRGLSLEGKVRLDEFRNSLRTFFLALPKDREGRLEHTTARYALHRFFVHRHSWSIKGLESGADVWHRNKSQALKDWVPSYLLSLMDEKLGHRGLDLEDLAALGAAIEDLIRKEASGTLEEVWNARNMSDPTSRKEMHEALVSYLVMYLGQGAWTLKSALTEEFMQKHTYWYETEEWLMGVEKDDLAALGTTVDFATAARIADDVGHRYGHFNDAECQKIKTTLMGAWGKGPATGRVRLVDFYKLGFELEEFNFAEKPDFLRAMGALDDTNASNPMVIIPNYVTAMPNCLQATSLYSICCRNECEDLMVQLEQSIAAPTAAPQQIAELVRSLSSGTVTAPREVSPVMLARLDSIAARHGGHVNIHGRLFAQWMHHAFPSECPYPHEGGVSGNPMDSERWQSEDLEASEQERKQHVAADLCGPEQASAEWVVDLPWTDAEELVSAEAMMQLQSAANVRHEATCQTMMFLVGLGFALAATFLPKEQRTPRVLVLSMVLAVAFITNAVNRFMLAFIVIGGFAMKLLSTSQGAAAKLLEKEKSTV